MNSTDGSTGSNGYQIREADSYDEAILSCGGHQFIDEALAPIDEALHRNPSGFKKIRPGSEIFFAKTKLRIWQGAPIPAMTLFFMTNEVTRTVTKLHVKYSEPESMSYGINPWDEDEQPF